MMKRQAACVGDDGLEQAIGFLREANGQRVKLLQADR
jgi:hypothetical protein